MFLAGIHKCGVWIPAFAGMTPWVVLQLRVIPRVFSGNPQMRCMDSRLRGNDALGGSVIACHSRMFLAGIHKCGVWIPPSRE